MTATREHHVNNAIAADAAAGRFARWGRSTTIDEHTGAPVLPPETVRALHALAGLETDGTIGNAGLVHLYGYLLSTVMTPYGPKHARWTGGGVALALGLEPEALLPGDGGEMPTATPLATLTPIAERLLETPPPGATVVDETGDEVVARTVLLTGPAGDLLVYGVGVAGPILPITVFPLDDAEATLAALEVEPPRLRYNAVDGSGRALVALESRSVHRR